MTTPRIMPPVRLDAHSRRLVSSAIEDALLQFREEDYFYIGERIHSKLEALGSSSAHWVRHLWLIATAFHMMLRDHTDGRRELQPNVRRLVGIGLHYLVNPFDVIPDHIAGDGYLDDAFVLNYCISRIDQRAPKLVGSYLRRAKREASELPCPR
jgi:uncharacterized membrane protein YkvA (DUF1232 family)